MKIYLFLAAGFEETEAITPLDLCRRAGIECVTVGVGERTVVGAHGIAITADITDDCLDSTDADGVILPGGMPGTLNLEASETVIKPKRPNPWKRSKKFLQLPSIPWPLSCP